MVVRSADTPRTTNFDILLPFRNEFNELRTIRRQFIRVHFNLGVKRVWVFSAAQSAAENTQNPSELKDAQFIKIDCHNKEWNI